MRKSRALMRLTEDADRIFLEFGVMWVLSHIWVVQQRHLMGSSGILLFLNKILKYKSGVLLLGVNR